MTFFDRLYILKTTSSEVNKVTLFKNRYTKYIPDFFFILCFGSLFSFSQTFDKIYIVLMFYNKSMIPALSFGAFAVLPMICSIWMEESSENFVPDCLPRNWLVILSALTGCGPILICWKILENMFQPEIGLSFPMKCHSFPIFHMSKNDMSFVKMYYLFIAAVKCIPQIYVVIGLLLGKYLTGDLASLGQVSLILNMVMFSLAMALTFPLRPRPRVYTDSIWLLFNALCKFLATACGCGVNLLTLAISFSSIGYYAFLIHFLRLFFWILPSWYALRSQPQHLGGFCFTFYLFFLALIFNIIYIHPFEGRGKLIYYFFYLFKFLTEIFTIFIFGRACAKAVIIYITFKTVMMGFLCCYGLVNILHKYKQDKSGCVMFLEAIIEVTVNGEKENVEKENVEKENVEKEIDEKNNDEKKIDDKKIVEKKSDEKKRDEKKTLKKKIDEKQDGENETTTEKTEEASLGHKNPKNLGNKRDKETQTIWVIKKPNTPRKGKRN